MKTKKKYKIGLGSAQWGMNYGISNNNGQSNEEEIKRIISYAEKKNINVIDTAANYGNAEEIIGKYLNSNFKLITKTPHFKSKYLTKSDGEMIISTFKKSLKNLNKKKIYCLMIHNYSDLFKNGSENIIKSLYELKEKNYVEKIGISIYSNCEVDKILQKFSPDLVQLPLNIFDQRLLNNGTIDLFKSKGAEIHVRSLFLQGLLLMKNIPNYFSPWKGIINKWNDFCKSHSKSKLEIALNFVNNLNNVDKLILGVENLNQLKQINTSLDENLILDLKEFACLDENLINPTNWQIND
tara:strand:- start:12 stop:899 length:888 start_codon:yes stop_codon:yes gene_type:complete